MDEQDDSVGATLPGLQDASVRDAAQDWKEDVCTTMWWKLCTRTWFSAHGLVHSGGPTLAHSLFLNPSESDDEMETCMSRSSVSTSAEIAETRREDEPTTRADGDLCCAIFDTERADFW